MSKETAKAGLDFFCHQISLNPQLFNQEKSIIIYGGEPLLNFDCVIYLLDLILKYQADKRLPDNISIALLTNGTLLTDEKADLLKKYHISISISLDGATDVANLCRKYQNGQASYPDVIRGINIAMKHGLDCGLSVTLTEDALNDLDLMEKMILDNNIKSLGFNLLMTDEHFLGPRKS